MVPARQSVVEDLSLKISFRMNYSCRTLTLRAGKKRHKHTINYSETMKNRSELGKPFCRSFIHSQLIYRRCTINKILLRDSETSFSSTFLNSLKSSSLLRLQLDSEHPRLSIRGKGFNIYPESAAQLNDLLFRPTASSA